MGEMIKVHLKTILFVGCDAIHSTIHEILAKSRSQSENLTNVNEDENKDSSMDKHEEASRSAEHKENTLLCHRHTYDNSFMYTVFIEIHNEKKESTKCQVCKLESAEPKPENLDVGTVSIHGFAYFAMHVAE